jgi:hypothetical protein
MHCCWCGHKLVKIPLTIAYALVCDNFHCQMFRTPQKYYIVGAQEYEPTPAFYKDKAFDGSYHARNNHGRSKL